MAEPSRTPVLDFVDEQALDEALATTLTRMALYLVYTRAGQRKGLGMASTEARLEAWKAQLLTQAGAKPGADLFRALDDHLEVVGAYA